MNFYPGGGGVFHVTRWFGGYQLHLDGGSEFSYASNEGAKISDVYEHR